MNSIDYDLIRKRAHRLRRDAIADLVRRAATKLRTLMAESRGSRGGTRARRFRVRFADVCK